MGACAAQRTPGGAAILLPAAACIWTGPRFPLTSRQRSAPLAHRLAHDGLAGIVVAEGKRVGAVGALEPDFWDAREELFACRGARPGRQEGVRPSGKEGGCLGTGVHPRGKLQAQILPVGMRFPHLPRLRKRRQPRRRRRRLRRRRRQRRAPSPLAPLLARSGSLLEPSFRCDRGAGGRC